MKQTRVELQRIGEGEEGLKGGSEEVDGGVARGGDGSGAGKGIDGDSSLIGEEGEDAPSGEDGENDGGDGDGG